MNAVGQAETPAHPRATSWRRDLDYKIDRALCREEEAYEEEQRQRARALLSDEDKVKFDRVFQSSHTLRQPGAMVYADPNTSALMRKLLTGGPISRAEARRGRAAW